MSGKNQIVITRHWLESLSSSELVKQADNLGIDIPPGLERIFIIEELLENANQNDLEEEKNDLEIIPSYTESVALPKQYNISYIEVIIRDPLWVFVFWEIKAHDRELHENSGDFKGYCLQVIPLKESDAGTTAASVNHEDSFNVPVEKEDCARYIGFAVPSSDETEEREQDEKDSRSIRYVIKLIVLKGGSELPIAVSAPFDLPRLMNNEIINTINQNPLIRLSGVQKISAIKNTDRTSRGKRQ